MTKSIFGLDNAFRDECMEHVIKDSYNYLPPEDEIIIRLVEYARKPHKKWYLPYINRYADCLDKERLFKHLDAAQIERTKVEALIAGIEEK